MTTTANTTTAKNKSQKLKTRAPRPKPKTQPGTSTLSCRAQKEYPNGQDASFALSMQVALSNLYVPLKEMWGHGMRSVPSSTLDVNLL